MKLVLDTHILIWLASDRTLLSARERAAIGDVANDLVASTISIWEIRTKLTVMARRGRHEASLDPAAILRFCRDREIDVISLDPEDCVTPLAFPIRHRDPFDEMILVHTHRIGARLLTRDRDLRDHPLVYQP